MSNIVFEYINQLGQKKKLVTKGAESRRIAIQLAEEALFDKIRDVTYTVTIDGEIVTKELDYFNDII